MMGYQFKALSGLDPFVIDQGRTVLLPGVQRRPGLLPAYVSMLCPSVLFQNPHERYTQPSMKKGIIEEFTGSIIPSQSQKMLLLFHVE